MGLSSASPVTLEPSAPNLVDVVVAGLALWKVLAAISFIIVIFAVASVIVSAIVRPAVKKLRR